MWKEVIETKLNSLAKHEVFGPVVYTPKSVIHVGYKWVFVKKKKLITMKLCNTRHDLLQKVSHRDLTLIMRKLILQLWMQLLLDF
jgi:hypothetical protein